MSTATWTNVPIRVYGEPMNIHKLDLYRVRPEVDYRHDSVGGEYAAPGFDLVHSTCNQVIWDHYVSVSLVEMMQRALDHNKVCSS